MSIKSKVRFSVYRVIRIADNSTHNSPATGEYCAEDCPYFEIKSLNSLLRYCHLFDGKRLNRKNVKSSGFDGMVARKDYWLRCKDCIKSEVFGKEFSPTYNKYTKKV